MLRLFLIAGSTLLPLSAAASDASGLASAHARTEKATRALLAGDAERAERGYWKALDAVPDFPPARLGLGHLALARDRPQDALDEYAAARRGYQDLGPALIEVERRRYEATRHRIAALHKEQATVERRLEDPGRREAERESLEDRLGRIRSRILQLEVVAPLEREGDGIVLPAEVQYHLGNALFRVEDLDGALEVWTECAARRPDFAPVHANLAVALMRARRFEEARESLARAERLGMAVDGRLKARLEALTGAGS